MTLFMARLQSETSVDAPRDRIEDSRYPKDTQNERHHPHQQTRNEHARRYFFDFDSGWFMVDAVSWRMYMISITRQK